MPFSLKARLKKSVSKSKTSNKRSALIILSAPSGCGKTTIVERLLRRHPDWTRSISVTTRSVRSGEKEGEDYFFVTPQTFREMKKKKEFLESAEVFEQHYGTPKQYVLDQIKQGKSVVLAIDVQGARTLRKEMGHKIPLVSIFVLPPSVKALRERLQGRNTETPEEIERRVEVAQNEIKAAGSYDFTVINQNLDETIQEIEQSIEKKIKERKKN